MACSWLWCYRTEKRQGRAEYMPCRFCGLWSGGKSVKIPHFLCRILCLFLTYFLCKFCANEFCNNVRLYDYLYFIFFYSNLPQTTQPPRKGGFFCCTVLVFICLFLIFNQMFGCWFLTFLRLFSVFLPIFITFLALEFITYKSDKGI